jgi:branched-chain amino acid transport system permease protein
MKHFLTLLFNGLTLGAIYALIALSFTMVYGVLKLINFAYAGLFTLGAYSAIWGLGAIGVTSSSTLALTATIGLLVLALLGAMAFTGTIGTLVERVAYRPLRHAPLLAPLISALGVVLILQNGVLLVAGSTPKFFPLDVSGGGLEIAGARLSALQITVVPLALGLMVVLYALVHRTHFGLGIRATADDIRTARLMGIRTDRTIGLVFFLGSALGGAAGVMYALYYGTATYLMGYTPSIKAFTAAVIGGIGNIPGAVLGGFLLGLMESFAAGYSGSLTGGAVGPNYQDVFAFLILIAILTVKPTGLLGARISR